MDQVLRTLGVLQPWTWFASFGFLAFLNHFVPVDYVESSKRKFRSWISGFSPYMSCEIYEYEGLNVNSLYSDIEMYLSALTAQASQPRFKLFKPSNSKELLFTMAHDQRTEDFFDNVKVEWVHTVKARPPSYYREDTLGDDKRIFSLQIRCKDKEILERYIAHIQKEASMLKREARERQLYTNRKNPSIYERVGPWDSVNFKHPATFDTLALDGDLKARICEDLDQFSKGESFYRSVGKAWKRGYLLYGPPGTGKTSMIAAIANKMRFDVYDLELTEVKSNSRLRKLLLSTKNKSIIVIEDIDCSLDLSGQRKRKKQPSPDSTEPLETEESTITLSGLLNFVDGLWSSCGEERIFIFTTNCVEKLDPALLRAGRMDLHIHVSYCTFSAFLVLAKNYLQLTEHELFDTLRVSFEQSYITPATVAEILMKEKRCPTVALESLLAALDKHREMPTPSTAGVNNADTSTQV